MAVPSPIPPFKLRGIGGWISRKRRERGWKDDVAQSAIPWKMGSGKAVVFEESNKRGDAYSWLANHTDMEGCEWHKVWEYAERECSAAVQRNGRSQTDNVTRVDERRDICDILYNIGENVLRLQGYWLRVPLKFRPASWPLGGRNKISEAQNRYKIEALEIVLYLSWPYETAA
jgi:hypothetical protein